MISGRRNVVKIKVLKMFTSPHRTLTMLVRMLLTRPLSGLNMANRVMPVRTRAMAGIKMNEMILGTHPRVTPLIPVTN